MEKIEEFSYVFKSGKYKDINLEWVFVKDPLHVSRIYAKQFGRKRDLKRGQLKNKLQLAIESLKEKIQSLDLVQPCPVCKKKRVTHFLLPDNGKASIDLVSCEDIVCQMETKLKRPGSFYKLEQILVIIPYLGKKDANTFIRAFRKAHNKDLLQELT